MLQSRYLENVATVAFSWEILVDMTYRILRQRQEWYPIYPGQQTLAMRQFFLLHFPAHFWLSEVSELEES